MIETPKTDLLNVEAYDSAVRQRRDETGEWGPVLQQDLFRAGLDACLEMDPQQAGALRPSVHVDFSDGTTLVVAAYDGPVGLCWILDRMDPRGPWDGFTALGTYARLTEVAQAALGASCPDA